MAAPISIPVTFLMLLLLTFHTLILASRLSRSYAVKIFILICLQFPPVSSRPSLSQVATTKSLSKLLVSPALKALLISLTLTPSLSARKSSPPKTSSSPPVPTLKFTKLVALIQLNVSLPRPPSKLLAPLKSPLSLVAVALVLKLPNTMPS